MSVAAASTGIETGQSYLNAPGLKKLHLGCGGNVLPGWLNTDLEPVVPGVLPLDLTQTFPFPDGTFDYVFSEHVIEHLSYAHGQLMLRQCHRVLKPGGRLRVSTPDLAFLVGLYSPEKSELQRRYIKWATKQFIPGAPYAEDTFVINNFVRDWGHTFIYDEKVLRDSLRNAAFQSIERCELKESPDPNLRGLENETRLPPGFLALETLTLEVVKSAN
jgi:predicted SAM-dependent methyltransferase